ncbi:MAG: Lipid A export ATP-binding/permease protein MsbA [Alphaproteobacteria bacterium MarineAlpha10_Bin3]|nr:MAG: Lipid A export ATP-binding/permease protein MsbA [Alphaproteobacteria bacterium MarineAlpha10_Bin3]PPR69598.1 MAG: Lipid A export ATP-binding/permease protein MsbA [Alphaproteobacteria bacterium MarineAlpha4_Bin1]
MVYVREIVQGGSKLAKRTKRKLRLDAPTRLLAGRIWRDYVRHHRGKILLSMLFMVAIAAATGGQARLIEPALDRVLVTGDTQLVWMIPLAFFAISVLKGFASYGQSVLMQQVGLRVVTTLQSQMFERIVAADLAFIQGDATGKLISRFTNDVNYLRNAVIKTVTGSVRDLLTVIVLVGVMFYTHWVMAMLVLVVFPLSLWPIIYIGRRLRRIAANTQAELGVLTALLDDVFKGARQVKAYGMEAHEQQRADTMFESIFRFVLKSAAVRARSYPIMESLGGLAIASVLCYGGYQVLNGETTVGKLIAFLTALVMAYQPVRGLAAMNASLQEGLAAAQRIFAMIDHRPSIVDAPDAAPLKVGRGVIRLDGVHFAYGGDIPALRGVTIDIPAGATVALVGPSGAGKSTVLNLLLRFHDVSDGSITIDGQDIRQATIQSLHQSIALVSQEIGLFDISVRDNIAYGDPHADDAAIVAAAKAAAAHEFIAELPQGYDTRIGERGLRLSGGQRQRLSIARAMLRDAPILLLDEATSALDTQSEQQVRAALKRLMANRTTLVIAHRLSTIADADIIYVLDNGQVAEQGTNAELLARGGLYARLSRLQFGNAPAAKA